MKKVVLVAPYFGGNMIHCMRCFAALDGVQLGIISQEQQERLPPDLAGKIAGFYTVADVGDTQQLVQAGRAFQREWGGIDRLEGYLEQLQVPIGEARDALGVEGLDGESAKNFRDKNRMKRILREAGLPVARQALISGPEDARKFVKLVDYPIVLKPLAGLGARNTVRVSSEEELYVALNQLMPTPTAPVQAEEFIRGEEHTFETVCIEGKPVWSSSTFYLPGPLQVLENPWMQYCLLLPREQQMPHVAAFKATNHAALATLGLRTGISHMEWFLMGNGRHVISEVGARPPGANIMPLMNAAHDTDLWAHWARLMVHKTWNPPARSYAAGCAFLRGMGRGNAVKALRGIEEAQRQIGPLVVSTQLPRVGQPRASGYEGEGWVIVRAPETRAVVEALRVLVTTIQVEMG